MFHCIQSQANSGVKITKTKQGDLQLLCENAQTPWSHPKILDAFAFRASLKR